MFDDDTAPRSSTRHASRSANGATARVHRVDVRIRGQHDHASAAGGTEGLEARRARGARGAFDRIDARCRDSRMQRALVTPVFIHQHGEGVDVAGHAAHRASARQHGHAIERIDHARHALR